MAGLTKQVKNQEMNIQTGSSLFEFIANEVCLFWFIF